MTQSKTKPGSGADLIDTDLVRDKVIAVRDAVSGELYERGEEVELALIGLLAKLHVFFLGAPGIAKTLVFDRVMARVDGARFYSGQMSKTMAPEVLLGPYSITGLKEDRFERAVAGYLPDADVALLDEVFRISATVSDVTLGILNERRFTNGTTVIKVPLATAFMAANQLPGGDDAEHMAAFWDRIHLRKIVNPPADRSARRAIMSLRIDPNPPVIITWAEIQAAQAEVLALPITDAALDAADEVIERLRSQGIDVSPRRWNQLQYPAAAAAWLAGADEVGPQHCEVLAHMLWTVPEQANAVERTVLEVVSPGQRAALAISDSIAEYADGVVEILALDAGQRDKALAQELIDKAKRHRKALDAALPQAAGRAKRTLEDAERVLDSHHRRLLADQFGVDLDALSKLSTRDAK